MVKDALQNLEEKIVIDVKDNNTEDYNKDNISKNINKILLENPEIDYGYKGWNSMIYPDKVEITLNYKLDKQTMKNQKDEVEKVVEQFLAEHIKSDMSAVEREIAIHDYIAKTAEYDIENRRKGNVIPENHTAYGVLVKHKGVCEGYAKAMSVLSKAAGLECKYVTGDAINEGPHAWNMVKLDDGEWYNVDVTWDDPVYDKPEDKWTEVQYNYLNLPDSVMNKTHKRDESVIKYPVAKGTKYAYENLDIKETDVNGNEFTKVKGKEGLDGEIKKAIENKQTTLLLKVYDVDMDQQQLLNEINVVCSENNLSVSRYSISSTEGSVKLVKYTFEY